MCGVWLLFSLPGCVLTLLVCVVVVAGTGEEQRNNTVTSPEQELYGDTKPHHHHRPDPYSASLPPPYLFLPMFRYQSTPAVSKELFSPVAGSRTLPSVLSDLLIPQRRQPHIRVTPVNNNHGVEVWCGLHQISVRINRDLLHFRGSAAHFGLGTCPASRANGSVLYFLYDLNECASRLSVRKGQLLYSNEVIYRPGSQGAVLRALPLTLPIQCVYDRFHYSYKIGFLPELRWQAFRKTLIRKQVFSLSVCDESWKELGVNSSYVLGEAMHFEVGVEFLPQKKSVYVESCHVAVSQGSNSTQRYDVINNFGCMIDSRRAGSQSHYVLRQIKVLRFSLDAFSFAEATSERFYLHCTVLLGNEVASSTAKSCTYVQSEHRWEELDGDASVCNCCDSWCRPPAFSSGHMEQGVAISKPWSLIHKDVSSETSDEWLNTVSGSVLLHHHRPSEGVEPERAEEGAESGVVEEGAEPEKLNESWREPEVVELEESEDEQEEMEEEEEEMEEEEEIKEEEEEEVVIGVAETKNDEMSDDGMEEADAVNLVKDREKEEERNLSAPKRKEVMQFSEEPWEGEEFLLGDRLSHGPAVETHSRPRGHVSESTVLD